MEFPYEHLLCVWPFAKDYWWLASQIFSRLKLFQKVKYWLERIREPLKISPPFSGLFEQVYSLPLFGGGFLLITFFCNYNSSAIFNSWKAFFSFFWEEVHSTPTPGMYFPLFFSKCHFISKTKQNGDCTWIGSIRYDYTDVQKV